MMNEDRRSFLRTASRAAIGIGCGLPILDLLGCSSAETSAEYGGVGTRQWAMVIDVKKCLDPRIRDVCVEACHREHNVPNIGSAKEDVKWIWSTEFENAFPDQSHAHMSEADRTAPVLALCNHCSKPPCVRVCPTGATWKREQDGIVMMDMHRCIGCRYCMAACPYGSRSFNYRDPRPHIPRNEDGTLRSEYPTRTRGVVEKCTFCAERLRDGRPPACVEAVSKIAGGEGAMLFGDLSDPNSNVNRALNENHTICRRPSLGTGPNVFYIV